jgi:hypothetical protein
MFDRFRPKRSNASGVVRSLVIERCEGLIGLLSRVLVAITPAS